MWPHSLWTSWTSARSRSHSSQQRQAKRRTRPTLEQFEDRCLPSIYSAETVSDLISDINAANAADGSNTISLIAPITSPYILTAVNNSDGAYGLPTIAANDSLTIEGNGDTIERSTASGTADFSLLLVDSGASLSLNSLILQNADGPGGFGGAIYNQGSLTVSNSTLSNNLSMSLGGAIYNSGTLQVSNSTFSNNSAKLYGGAIGNYGPATVSGCTFTDNSSQNNGGAIDDGNQIDINNSTFFGNTAANYGGAISDQGFPTLLNDTITGNSASFAGGIANYYLTVTLQNTILTGNTSTYGPANLAEFDGGTLTDDGNNLLGTDLQGSTSGPGDIFTNNPGFSPLGDYGGPTQTMALLPTSPALGAGNPGAASVSPTDQRGLARIVNGTVDIGAFQTQPNLQVTTTADPGQSAGNLSLREAVTLANIYATSGTTQTISFASCLSGDTITLAQGLLELSGTGGGVETIDGGDDITVSGNGTTSLFQVDAGATAVLTGLTLTGALNSGLGGAVLSHGTLTVSNSTLSNNIAEDAGAILNYGQLSVSSSTFRDNSALILNNSTYHDGGAVDNYGTATVTDSTFTGNSAADGGGGAFANGGTLALFNDTITGNSAASGGGLFSISTLNVSSCQFVANSADSGDGGAIFNDGITSIDNSTFYDNSALGANSDSGGGIYSPQTITLNNCTFASNESANGPDFYGSATGSNNVIDNGSGLSLAGANNQIPATQLAFANVPASVAPGQNFNFQVDVEDQNGNPVTGDYSEVTATLIGPGSFTGGSTTAQDQGGVASFSDMAITTPGNYTLTVTDGTLQSAAVNLQVAAQPVLKVYPIASGNMAEDITAGPDGNIWFTEYSNNEIGEINPATGAISEYPTPNSNSRPVGIVAADGELWFTEAGANQIGEINPATHQIVEYPITTMAGSEPYGITLGPDGNLWFTEYAADNIGEFNLSTDAITDFAVPTSASGPDAITTGPDGNIWFTELTGNNIGMFNPATPGTQNVQEYSLSTPNSLPSSIVSGPSGRLWFTEQGSNRIGFITTAGTIDDFPVPTSNSAPTGIAVGADGNLWFTEEDGNQIGRMNPLNYAIEEFPAPTKGSLPFQITAGTDGNLWYTDDTNEIGEVDLNPSASGGGGGSSSGPATQMAYATVPTSVVAGEDFNFQVDVEDESSALATTDTSDVSVTLTGPGTLNGGSATVQVVDGVADFTGMVLDAAGSYKLALTDGSLTAPPAVTLVVIAANPAALKLSAPVNTATVGAAFSSPVSVIAVDSFGNPVADVPVTFAIETAGNGAGASFSGNTQVNTNAQGLATAPELTANDTAGSYSVTAADAGADLQSSVQLTNLAGAAVNVIPLIGMGQNVTVASAYSPLEAMVTDRYGNPVANVPVTFAVPDSGASGMFISTATVLTNAQGIATAPALTANDEKGNFAVTATANGVVDPADFELTNISSVPASISAVSGTPLNTLVGYAFGSLLQAQVVDSYNNPVANVPVTFSVPTFGATGSFNALATVLTNAQGIATAPALIANHEPGSFTATATATGVANPADFTLTNTAVPSSIKAASGSGQRATVNTAFPNSLQVQVTGSGGIPVSGITVNFEVPGSGASGTFASFIVVTNASGIAIAPKLTANTIAGNWTVDAWVAGIATPAAFRLTNAAGAASDISSFTGNNQSSTVAKAFATDLQALVVDSFGNPVSGASVTFSIISTSGSAGGAFAGGKTTAVAITGTNGVAKAPALTANTVEGSFTVKAAVSGVLNPATFSLTNKAAPPNDPAGSSVQSAVVGDVFGQVLQARVSDKYGNPIAGVTVTFTAPAQGASGSFAGQRSAIATTGPNGVAIAPPFTANNEVGTYVIVASVRGVASEAEYHLTNLAGPSAFLNVGPSQSATVGEVYSHPLTATVTDAFGNPVSGVAVIFTTPETGASGSFAKKQTITVLTNTDGVAIAPPFTANDTIGEFLVEVSALGLPVHQIQLTNMRRSS